MKRRGATIVEIGDRVAIKAFVFGARLPFATLILHRFLPSWFAWGIAVSVWTALFHWLPPRIHTHLTPLRSAVLCLAAGVTAAVIVFSTERVPA